MTPFEAEGWLQPSAAKQNPLNPVLGAAITMSVSNDRLIKGRDADAITVLTRSARHRAIREGKHPKPIKLGSATRYSEQECHAWVAARIADRDGGRR